VLVQVCDGIVRVCERLRAIDPEIVFLHVDASERYRTSDPALDEEVQFREALVFLALDFVSGRVDERHPLFNWMLKHGTDATRIFSRQERPGPLDVIGMNLYPMFSNKRLTRRGNRLRGAQPYTTTGLVEELAEQYWARYQRPLIISETASTGTVARRRAWLHHSVDAVARVRARGIPLVGYTWWPVFGLIRWAYQRGRLPKARYLEQMGLWDIALTAGGRIAHRPTPLVDAFHSLVLGGDTSVGPLAPTAL
jgi:hypothetical protein